MNRKRLSLVIIFLLLVFFGIVFFRHHNPSVSPQQSNSRQNPPANPARSSSTPTLAALSKLIQDHDNPAVNGISYTATSIAQPIIGWFVVKVTATNNYGSFDQIVVVKQQEGDTQLDLVVGPSTAFSVKRLQLLGIPQAVINRLPVYEDG